MKIGIVGLGYWGPNLVRNFMGCEGIDGVVCCDTQAKRMQKTKQRFPSVELAETFPALLSRTDVGAVAIATPVPTHFALGKSVLEAGKHLLLEKPMAGSSQQAMELVELARDRGLVLMVDHTFIYTGAVRKIREIIDQDVLGEMYYFDSVRVNLGLFQHDTNVIWDLAPHDLSIMSYLIDKEPVSVSAVGVNHFNGVEDMAYLTVRFEDKLMAHFHVNWLSPVKVRTILIGGSKHMVVFDDMEPSEKVKVYDKGVDLPEEESMYRTLVQYRRGDMYAPQIDSTEALGLLTQEFIDCIGQRKQPTSDGLLGLNVVRMLEAAETSLRLDGQNVELVDTAALR